MPWKEVTIMNKKESFIASYLDSTVSFTKLCTSFGISTKTGYKYLARYKKYGYDGLKELARTPHTIPCKTSSRVENIILEIRHLHPSWGGGKIKTYLQNKGYENLPTEKTIDRILKRNGLITFEESEKHKPFIRFEHPNPNDLWQMDFKGHFATTQNRCHPLTLLDDHSRFSLLIQACENERGDTVKEALINVFKEYGLPARMTMDNGSPWGYSGKQEHTTLTAWLIRLGIIVMHSRPMHPQTQGKLERFHRTFKLELLSRFEFDDLENAQKGFDGWRKIYNEERPHEAIGNKRPIDRYRNSERPYGEILLPIEYNNDMLTRKVQQGGLISFKGKEYRVGHAFYGYPVGLKESNEDGVYDVYFCQQRVVKIDLKYPI
jgi:transposase InsO family protein